MCWLALYACDDMRWQNCERVQLSRHLKIYQGHFDDSIILTFKIAGNGTGAGESDEKYDDYSL